MKNAGAIEKGILRRALAGILPDDARNRRKSAYPTSQNPTYLEALRKWVLDILNDANSPIRPLINVPLLLRVAEGSVPLPGDIAAFQYERIIQTNAWLKDYRVNVC
jgi:asparagine synthase (glutamine-hydrolysing)